MVGPPVVDAASRAYDAQAALCPPSFQSAIWHSLLQYPATLHLEHFIKGLMSVVSGAAAASDPQRKQYTGGADEDEEREAVLPSAPEE